MADSKRQLQFSRMIRKDLTLIFSKNYHIEMKNTILTISYVRMSVDLSIANVFVSIYPSQEKDKILQNILAHTAELRFLLGKRIGKKVRFVPQLNFFYDDLMDESDKVKKILEDIN